jgi:prefoldin subunit 5
MSISGSELLDAKTDSSIDEIAGLLEASRNSKFDDDEDVLHVKEEFEKIGNFFDLVRTGDRENSNNSQISDEVENEYSTSESPSDVDEPSLLLDEKFIVPEDEYNEDSSSDGSDESISGDQEVLSSKEQNLHEVELPEDSEFISEPIVAVDPEEFEVDNNTSNIDLDDDRLKAEFERGYSEAVLQLEKSIDHEKLNIQNLSQVLFSIQNDVADLTSEMIKRKISDIAIEFLGEKIDELPDKFLKKIHDAVGDISKYLNDITVELNELDALALQVSKNDADAFTIKFKTNQLLERGEFKITDSDTYYSKQHL